MAFVNVNNRYPSALAIVSGVIITITRLLVPRFYPSQSSNGWATLFAELSTAGLKPFAILAGGISLLVEFGGITIALGGFLCLKNHLRSGKELVSIGASFGFADLLLAIPSLGTTSAEPVYLSVVGWIGLLFAVIASRHIKGPKRTYAGELRWFMSSLTRRLSREDERRIGRRLRKRRSR